MSTKKKRRFVIVGNGTYGLYCGLIEATDAEVAETKAVRVFDCRNIRYWYGGKGGITSLAAWGPSGPRAQESRIGAPAPSSLVTDVKAIHDCSPEAVKAFASIVAGR